MVVHLFVPTQNIRGGVSFWVSYVKSRSGWVGEHIEDEVLRLGRIKSFITWVGCVEGFVFVPMLLPLGLKIGEGEWFTLVGHFEFRIVNVE